MNLMLYPHGGCGNHGCEAIIRSTYKITKANILLFSESPNEDIKYRIDKICTIRNEKQNIDKYSFSYIKALVNYNLHIDRSAFDKIVFKQLYSDSNKTDIALSIGGDNYCYGDPYFIYTINKELHRHKIKTVLWGCSINSSSLNEIMLKDLYSYNHIFARESITYETLINNGIKNISLFPDPAFQLDKICLELPQYFIPGNTVGINLSPMIIYNEKMNGIVLENYKKLIQYIIDHTDMQIALIPHVVWKNNDDRNPMRTLYNYFHDSDRIVMIDDNTSEVLKGFISRCRFMIAARTHASIAAYSESIPTIVVGYSVKAKGIAKDIFGTDENYVIPVQDLQKKDDLTNGFKWLLENEDRIKELYKDRMPLYKSNALKAGYALNTI